MYADTYRIGTDNFTTNLVLVYTITLSSFTLFN